MLNQFTIRIQRFAHAAVCISPLLLLASCGKESQTIAVFPKTTGTPLWEALHAGVVDAASGTGDRIYWNAPSDDADTSTQLDLLEAYRDKHYRGIIFAPIDAMAARSILLETGRDHIPVVLVDDMPGPQPSRYLSYVGTDEKMGGRMAAQYIAKLLNGKGSIAIIGISGRLMSTSARDNAFEDAIAHIAPRIQVKKRLYGDENAIHQQQEVETILTDRDRVDAIVALSSASTRGAIYAKIADSSGRKVSLVGFDQDMLVPLEAGELDALIAQNTKEIGRLAMLNIQAEMRGDPTQGVTTVPPTLVTRENLHSPAVTSLWDVQAKDWSRQ